MARQQAIFPQVNFVNGLITETTALTFPENACTETWNCVFEHTGRVSRRPGIDVEDNYSMMALPQLYSATDSYSEYFWEVVGTQDANPFLIVQRGAYLYIFKTKNTLQFSDTPPHQVIDLGVYRADPNSNPALEKCSFAEGRGHLLVTNKMCDPLYLTYSSVTDVVVANRINIKYRDFKGAKDYQALTARLTASVSDLKNFYPEHYYNLLNQGWHLSDALAQWDSARTDMPSNADYVQYYRESETDAFNPSKVNNAFSGVANTPAPKGHFILDAGSPSRTNAMIAEGFTGAIVNETGYSRLALTGLTTISGGSIGNSTATAFDGNNWQPSTITTNLGVGAYVGKTLASATRLVSITVHGSQTGFLTTGTVQVYAKAGSAPSNSTDGTLLGTMTISKSDLSNRIITTLLPSTTAYNHFWIRNATGNFLHVSEIDLYSSTEEYHRPSLVAFYAGRAVYGGLANEGGMNSIYFSQIIERDEQYGMCYQKNDPTDENFNELLADDGGVLVIPELGNILAMIPFQSSLIIIASNGVWSVSGSNRSGFKADDYEVRKISDISTPSSYSIAIRRGVPIWWSEDGIYTIQYDANYDSFTVISVSENKISTFIKAIPLENRKYVKSVYNYIEDRLYWLYREDELLNPGDQHNYNRMLVMDGQTGAFYPWSFSEEGLLKIKGAVYVRLFDSASTPRIKFIVENSTDNTITFAEIKDTFNWVDWAVQGDLLDYQSRFVTGYKIRGEGMKKGHIVYFMPFMDELENSSLFVQTIYDFTTHPSTGKWSNRQQCYIEGPFQKLVRTRRLKIRGVGKALQLRFESETAKPFSLIGWATLETVNSDV